MSLLNITLHYHTTAWFYQCAEHLRDNFGCKILPQEKYLRLKHVSTLLNKDKIETLNWIAKHKKVHGFIINDTLYVHPTAFSISYLRKVTRSIDKGYHLEHPLVN